MKFKTLIINNDVSHRKKKGFSECIAMCNAGWICTICRLLSKWIHPSSGMSSYQSPPVAPVSRDVRLFALNSTVYTTNYKAYHLLPVPHKPSVPVSLLPPLCVRVCVCAYACACGCMSTHGCQNMCVCVCVCSWGVFSVSNEFGHISYLLAHTTSAQLTPLFKLFDALPLH